MDKYLNLGCGSRFHPDWINVNYFKSGKGVKVTDLSRKFPFNSGEFKVIYHSHLLEHFPKSSASDFLSECYRVLKPKGIIRVVVPDLESIAHQYLSALEEAKKGDKERIANYEWILLEMYDQVARDQSGGEMARYLSKENILNENYVIKRCGIEARNLIETSREKRDHSSEMKKESVGDTWVRKLLQVFRYSEKRKELLIRLLLKDEYNTLELGRFRKSGEIHHWMYDSFSLGRLIEECGFVGLIKRSATESYIQNWSGYNLDTEPDGSIYKPDSLYMEAIKS